jgi:hypothetical protein
MAFRVFPFRFEDFGAKPGASVLPCEFVGEHDAYDAFFIWLNPERLTEVLGDEGVPWMMTWVGAIAGTGAPVWIVSPPQYKGSGVIAAAEDWLSVRVVFNADPVEGLATLLRKHFIGMPYAEYLKTPHWQEVRESALKAADYRCQVCYSPDRLHVHHRTYDRRGRELLSDLTVLCADCHGRFHDKLPKE